MINTKLYGHEQEIFQKLFHKFSIKVCNVEAECYLFHHNLFSLVANHKKVALLGSQKERRREIREHATITKCYNSPNKQHHHKLKQTAASQTEQIAASQTE